MRDIPRLKHDPSEFYVPLESDMGSVRMAYDPRVPPEEELAAATWTAEGLIAAKPELAREAATQAARLPLSQMHYLAIPFPHNLAAQVKTKLQIAVDWGTESVWKEREQDTGRKDREQVTGYRLQAAEDSGSPDSEDDDRKKDEEAAAAAGAASPEKQGAQGDTSQQPPKAEDRNSLDAIAEATVADYVNWVQARAQGAAIDGLKDGLTPDQVEQKVERTVMAASDGAARRAAAEAASQAVFVGRMEGDEGSPRRDCRLRARGGNG
jgi:hypothetical protein